MKKPFRSYDLAVAFYHQVQPLQPARHLKEQLDRAAASIVLNLSEGRGRQTKADQRRFFSIAFGSLRECQAILDLAGAENTPVWHTADILGAHLYRLIQRRSPG